MGRLFSSSLGLAALAFCGLGIACQDGVERLEDPAGADGGTVDGAVPAAYCPSTYYDLDGAGELVEVESRCAEGALCGITGGYGACAEERDGSVRRAQPLVGSYGPPIFGRYVAEMKSQAPHWPLCALTSDCPGSQCFFHPGCGAIPEGICCGNIYTICFGIRPESDAMRNGIDTYCGCDGETFIGLPNRPYAHPGACP